LLALWDFADVQRFIAECSCDFFSSVTFLVKQDYCSKVSKKPLVFIVVFRQKENHLFFGYPERSEAESSNLDNACSEKRS